MIYNDFNLHIFVTFAKFAAMKNERRKINVQIFTIRNMCEEL